MAKIAPTTQKVILLLSLGLVIRYAPALGSRTCNGIFDCVTQLHLRNPRAFPGRDESIVVQQEDDLKAWVGAALPRSTRQIGAWIEKEFGLVYESQSRRNLRIRHRQAAVI
jgi:hypothetical protein